MEMEQLVSMGFPEELAAEALAATGGDSTVKATEWILSHKSSSASSLSLSLSPSPPKSQPKLDHFFPSKETNPPYPKRLKPSTSSSSSTAPTPNSSFFFKPPPRLTTIPNNNNNNNKHQHHHQPLYERLRPTTLDDVVGQDHLLSPSSLLRSSLRRNRLPSILLWGPPGTGKTTLAKAIVSSSKYHFLSLSAVTSGVKDVRDAVDQARKLRLKSNQTTVLFIDEVHRFNKSQQDSFLPVIEDGSIVFIGATTENPSFHLVTPLLSRCRVLTLNPLQPHHVALLLNRAINHRDKGLMQSVGFQVDVSQDVVDFIANNCDGDARVALNVLEIAAVTAAARVQHDSKQLIQKGEQQQQQQQDDVVNEEHNKVVAVVTLDDAKEALQSKHLAYDRDGEEHYNLISALHKSMRGSDADAAIYWLVRMLEGGEQPLYIARRLVRFASEDVGLADPSALTQAVSCYQACHFIGMPECNVILAQCVAYLALAPKSIAVYRAMGAAQEVVRKSIGQNEGVPLHLRNAPTKLMKDVGYGKGYIYTPDDPDTPQTYLPPSLQGYKFLDWPDRKKPL